MKVEVGVVCHIPISKGHWPSHLYHHSAFSQRLIRPLKLLIRPAVIFLKAFMHTVVENLLDQLAGLNRHIRAF